MNIVRMLKLKKNVTRITEHNEHNLGKTLDELRKLYDEGKLTGLVFACKYGPMDHGIGIAGDYYDDPIPALAVAGRLFRALNRFADENVQGDV
ncbi:MAG: hypothetical protein JWM53_5874 [bacterium]|nr:hypothetical protein [bacterium]